MNEQNNMQELSGEQQDCTPRCDGSLPPGCDGAASDTNDCMTGRSLAMVYSPCQEFEEIYAPEAGLSRGTIFMKLDKPFLGAGRLK